MLAVFCPFCKTKLEPTVMNITFVGYRVLLQSSNNQVDTVIAIHCDNCERPFYLSKDDLNVQTQEG